MQGVSAAELPPLQAQELSVFYNLLFAPRRHYLYRTGQWENLLLTDKMELDPLSPEAVRSITVLGTVVVTKAVRATATKHAESQRPRRTVSQHWTIFHLSQIYKRDT